MPEPSSPKWLLLIHQIPPKPAYFRVKVWRRLQRLGAVTLKNTVYALPCTEQTVEDFQWVLREISSGGGDATLCEARFVDGLTDGQIEAMFHQARDADYEQLAKEARRLTDELPQGRPPAGERRAQVEADLARLRKRLAEIASIDHLGAPGRAAADRRLATLEQRLRAPARKRKAGRPVTAPAGRGALKGRTWVTRKGIHIDRMASAWLIRRFIDPAARFKFVPAAGYRPASREVRFDMFEAEFTHEEDRCTFETLIEKFSLKDAALRPIAEIVHDIDLKDMKYGREETAGIDRLVAGIAMAHHDDEARLARGSTMLDDLYEYFRRKRS